MSDNVPVVSGVLLINKPLGLSSAQVVAKIKWLLNLPKTIKIGHTGTLDPLATGLLPICLGDATKYSSFLLDADKEYIATIKLGVSTSTFDAEGEITEQKPSSHITINDVENVLKQFIGEIKQIPPIYSALKVNGKALYEYAREGNSHQIALNDKIRTISVYQLDLLSFDSEQSVIKVKALVSKGTYIRTLAHDIGISLGVGAHLTGLIRSKTNDFKIGDSKCISLSDLAELVEKEKEYLLHLKAKYVYYEHKELIKYIYPTDSLLVALPSCHLSEEQFYRIKNGATIKLNDLKNVNITPNNYINYKLYFNSKFIGVGVLNTDNYLLNPKRLVNFDRFTNL